MYDRDGDQTDDFPLCCLVPEHGSALAGMLASLVKVDWKWGRRVPVCTEQGVSSMFRTHVVRQSIIAACALLFSASLLGMSAAPTLAQSAATVRAPAAKTTQPNLCIENTKTHTYFCCNKGYSYKCCNLKTYTNSCCLSTGSGVHNSGCCAYQGNTCCSSTSERYPAGAFTSKWKNGCGTGGGGCINTHNTCGYGGGGCDYTYTNCAGGCGYGNVWSTNNWCCGYAYPNGGYQYPYIGNVATGHSVSGKSLSGKWSLNCGYGYGGGCYSSYGGYSYGYGNNCCYISYAKPQTTPQH
jgi:hypothetical protein